MSVFTKVCFSYSRDGHLDIISLYLNRFMRLTPILAVVTLFSANTYRFVANGPLWPAIDDKAVLCRRYWYSTLLHIQNYVNPLEMV